MSELRKALKSRASDSISEVKPVDKKENELTQKINEIGQWQEDLHNKTMGIEKTLNTLEIEMEKTNLNLCKHTKITESILNQIRDRLNEIDQALKENSTSGIRLQKIKLRSLEHSQKSKEMHGQEIRALRESSKE